MKRLPLFSLLFLLLIPSILQAQSDISRVSLAERSDGLGFVFRFHMEERADSFRVFQPNPGLIQVAIYTEFIDTTAFTAPEPQAPLDDVSLHPIPTGVGIDIYLEEDNFYIADAYFDGNSKDLLLALTTASAKDLEVLTEGINPIAWEKLVLPEGILDDTLMTELDTSEPAQLDPYADDSYNQLKDKLKFDVVVIDAGHGGKDPGTIGYRGVREKDIVLNVAKKLGSYITKNMSDVKVVYTREKDEFIELEERGSIANQHEGDLFISIHCNAAGSRSAHGAEVFFLGLHRSKSAFEVMKKENSVIRLEDSERQQTELTEEELLLYELANSGYMATSQHIAGMVERQFAQRAQRRSRGVKQAGFIVLFHASMPALLVELGFITNPSEQRFLTSEYGQSIMASAIFRAVRDYKEEYDRSQEITNYNK